MRASLSVSLERLGHAILEHVAAAFLLGKPRDHVHTHDMIIPMAILQVYVRHM